MQNKICSLCLVLVLLSACTLSNQYSLKFILYPVKQGDTLRSISQRFSVPVKDILANNNLYAGAEPDVGDLLRIPYFGPKVATSSSVTKTKTATPEHIKPDQASARLVALGSSRNYIRKLAWPVHGAELVSPFGKRWFSFHEGIDLAATSGTPIYAAHSGEVVYSGDGLRGYGNLVVIKAAGLLTVYGHNSRNLVRVGQQVERGEEIALVGETGKAQGPHLHFETRIKDQKGLNAAVDPLVFYPGKG